VHGTGARTTVNPHNDYLLIAAQVGIPGVAFLLTLYFLVWRGASRLESPLHRDLARGLVIAMAVGGCFNSLLLDHTEGLLFAWLTAVLYAGYNRMPQRDERA
jgi:O-antigen ligase